MKPMQNTILRVADLVAVMALLALSGGAAAQPAASSTPPPMPTAEEFKFTQTQTVDVEYLLYLPRGCRVGGERRWPLMLFLHGAGERGTNVQRVAVHGPLKLVNQGKEFPFIIAAPLCPERRRWSNEPLLKLLDHIEAKYPVDRRRVYLTGLSLGGYGTWSLGLAHPERFTAIAPICGGGQLIDALLVRRERPEDFKTLGVWAFHGGKDDVVPLDESERMVEGLKKLGCQEVKLTVYPEAKHDSWSETYNNPEFYDWLLKHERGGSQ